MAAAVAAATAAMNVHTALPRTPDRLPQHGKAEEQNTTRHA